MSVGISIMCGFAGIVTWNDRFRFTRETLTRMNARLAHRGPDGDGAWLNHEAEPNPERPQAGLAHRRLAILDPDPRANQPFTDGHGRWLAFNGEIYNFRELRKELQPLLPDYAWRTDGDTEVLLAAYAAWGEQCVDRLNGMFAFAVWDESRGGLFLARDRMGQKPLYVAHAADGQAVAFASELPALLTLDWVDRSIDPTSLHHYLAYGYTPPTRTLYRGVGKLPPAHRAWMKSGRTMESARCFDPNESSHGEWVAGESLVQAVRRLTLQAVRRQLVADVPLGCFLSGGIDSSIVAAAMKQATEPDQPVLTFSIGFDDPRYDETEYAAKVAAHLGTRHERFVVRPDAAEDLPKLAVVLGEPLADSSILPTHYLARETRRHVKVALSGDGGDELFGGYDRYRALALAERLPHPLRAMAGMLGAALPHGHPKSTRSRLKRLTTTLAQPAAARYIGYIRLFDAELLRSLLREPPADDSDPLADDFTRFTARRGVVESALALDRMTYLPEDLLVKIDRASMLHALEVRSPFMDPEITTLAAGLAQADLLGGGPKRLLREAFADDLPAWIFRRRKMGFAVPVGDWFRKELRPLLHDSLFAADALGSTFFHKPVIRRLADDHESGRRDHSHRLFALLMLELCRRATISGRT